MSVKMINVLILSLVLAVVAMPKARAADEGKHKGNAVTFVLKHADELKLTDEEKTKLEALGKELTATPPTTKEDKEAAMAKVTAILTPEQQAQLKELRAKGKPAK